MDRRAALLLLTLAVSLLTGCRAPTTAPRTESSPVDEAQEPPPADAAGVRSHATVKAVFGPWWGSGCPANGDCVCGGARDLAQEANCQLDRLQSYDIPVSVYLFDGSAWSSVPNPTGYDLWDVWASAPDRVIAVGKSINHAAALHWNGSAFTPSSRNR